MADFADGFEWDAAKRARNLARHGLDFEDAIAIWHGPVLQRRSDRGLEVRFVAYGQVAGRVLAVVWTARAARRRIISARMANRHERSSYHACLEARLLRPH